MYNGVLDVTNICMCASIARTWIRLPVLWLALNILPLVYPIVIYIYIYIHTHRLPSCFGATELDPLMLATSYGRSLCKTAQFARSPRPLHFKYFHSPTHTSFFPSVQLPSQSSQSECSAQWQSTLAHGLTMMQAHILI